MITWSSSESLSFKKKIPLRVESCDVSPPSTIHLTFGILNSSRISFRCSIQSLMQTMRMASMFSLFWNRSRVCTMTGLSLRDRNCLGIAPPIRVPAPPARMMATCFMECLCDVNVQELFHEHVHVFHVPDGDAQKSGGVALAAEYENVPLFEFFRDFFRGLVPGTDADEAAFRRNVGIPGFVKAGEQTLLPALKFILQFFQDAVVIRDHFFGEGERGRVHCVMRLVVLDVLYVVFARNDGADAEARHGKHFGEGSDDDDVVIFLQEFQRAVLIEIVVGFVDDDERVGLPRRFRYAPDFAQRISVADGHARVHEGDEACAVVNPADELLYVECVVAFVMDELG